MTDTDIIQALRERLYLEGGRHLYGVLGGYQALEAFAKKLPQAKDSSGKKFPKALHVNRGILDSIPDDEFKTLVEDEARVPEPVRAHVARAFERFLRKNLETSGLLVLSGLELLFSYQVELNLLRTIAADDFRVILLLPGKRAHGKIIMFPDLEEGAYTLPTSLIAENHLWELTA
jgi:hypothetical protein